MKIALAALLFVASACAQAQFADLPAACGPSNVIFKVKLDNTQHTLAQPEPGKALVYFIQDDGPAGNAQHYTLKIGLDSAWAGAYKTNSYLTASVEPGVHHVCANVQSGPFLGSLVSLAHFSAESGKVYFFHTRFIAGVPGEAPPYLVLDPVDSDEAKYQIATFPLSVSQPRKMDESRQSPHKDTR